MVYYKPSYYEPSSPQQPPLVCTKLPCMDKKSIRMPLCNFSYPMSCSLWYFCLTSGPELFSPSLHCLERRLCRIDYPRWRQYETNGTAMEHRFSSLVFGLIIAPPREHRGGGALEMEWDLLHSIGCT